jgi:twitching motility protein PilT
VQEVNILDIDLELASAIEKNASDLHLNVGVEPMLRVDGRLRKVIDLPPMTQDDAMEVVEQITSREQRERFFQEKELDFSYQHPQLGRHRVNLLIQKGVISIAFRLLAAVLTPLESLGLPPVYGELSLRPRGLILVTGPTGSGKSTSLAAMIKHINEREERHIITIEDPVEYVHENNRSLILQRNVGEDTMSFNEALRRALRHDPDVIVIGEMRDLTTIATAISAAETGHLVLGTLHTIDATETVNRIVDVFPAEQQSQIVLQLSQTLVAVLSQTLVPQIGGGRVPACEIMISNVAVKNTIRQKQIHMLQGIIELGRKDGMQTLNQSLAKLVEQGFVSRAEAMAKSSDAEALEKMLSKSRAEVAC